MPHDSQLPSILNPEPRTPKDGAVRKRSVIANQRARWCGNPPDFQTSWQQNQAVSIQPGGCHTSDIGHWFAATYFSNSPVFSYIRLPQNRPIRQRNGVAVQIQGAVVFQTGEGAVAGEGPGGTGGNLCLGNSSCIIHRASTAPALPNCLLFLLAVQPIGELNATIRLNFRLFRLGKDALNPSESRHCFRAVVGGIV